MSDIINIQVQETVENVEIVAQNNVIEVNITRQSGGGGGAVDSVNGQTGVVVLDATDVDALQRDGSNANSDVDLGAFNLNAKGVKINGTAGAGHLGLKHQSANPTAGGQETVIFAGSDGEPRYKNDGGAIEQLASQSFVTSGLSTKENTITAGTTSQYYRGDKTFQTLDKNAVGLGNVDNTSDLNKPISTATQTALDGKADDPVVTDISLTSTIVGWSLFTRREITVVDYGACVLVIWALEGVSNSSSATFTLPFTNTGGLASAQIRVQNNGTFQTASGLCQIVNGSAMINMFVNNTAAAFTASNNKATIGQILIRK